MKNKIKIAGLILSALCLGASISAILNSPVLVVISYWWVFFAALLLSAVGVGIFIVLLFER